MTPAYEYEDVRVALVAHTELLPGWKVAAHLFGGTDKQGAIMGGPRCFDLTVTASAPAPGGLTDRSGGEYLATGLRLRIRQGYQPLQGATTRSVLLQDRRNVERHLRAWSTALRSGMEVRWLGTAEPVERVAGFLDTDIMVEVRHWSIVTGPVGSGQGGGVR